MSPESSSPTPFTLKFIPMMETSIPVDDIIAYLNGFDQVTTKSQIWKHLSTHQITKIDLTREKDSYIYGLQFDLALPFPHHLYVMAREEDIVGIVDLVHGTEYEEKTIDLFITYHHIKSKQVYWTWKREQARFQ